MIYIWYWISSDISAMVKCLSSAIKFTTMLFEKDEFLFSKLYIFTLIYESFVVMTEIRFSNVAKDSRKMMRNHRVVIILRVNSIRFFFSSFGAFVARSTRASRMIHLKTEHNHLKSNDKAVIWLISHFRCRSGKKIGLKKKFMAQSLRVYEVFTGKIYIH